MKCNNRTCTREATHALKMCVPDRNFRAHHAWGFLGICLCADHTAEAEGWEGVGDNMTMRMLLSAAADGDADLDFDEAYVQGVPLDSQEHSAWREMETRVN